MSGQEFSPASTAVIASGQSGPPPSGAFGAGGLRAFASRPVVRKSIPALAGAAGLMVAGVAWWSMQLPPQRPLFAELADADKSAVIDALQAASISHSVDRNTGAITVAEDEVHRARILLAGQGLPKASPSAASVVSALPIGSSRAVEGEALRGGREADLARTIEAIESVKAARVHLATPEPSVFVREAAPPAASVMLTLRPGRGISDGQVRAIKHLVAASVPAMTPDRVTVLDQSGTLLSQPGGAGGDVFQEQVRLEERYRQSIVALLTPIAGEGNFTTEVRIDIDRSESQSTRETFPQGDRVLVAEQGYSRSAGSNDLPPALGIPGAVSNQPPAQPRLETGAQVSNAPDNLAPTPSSGEENFSRKFDVGREISVTHQGVGRVRRVSAAVVLRVPEGGKARNKAELAALETLVKGAVGFDAARGDVVAISARPFAEVAEAEVAIWERSWFFPVLRQLGAVVIALLVLFFIGRPIAKAVRARVDRGPLEIPRGESGATAPGSEVTLDMIETAPGYAARADLVRDFVRQDPQRAAVAVRTLVQERDNGR